MTTLRLVTDPTLDEIKKFKELKSDTIYIKSSIMHGVAGLLIESIWRVNYENKSIYLITSNLISYIDKTPLTPLDIPDRHLRAARKIGAALFDTKRFDNLVLFETTDPSIIYSVTRGEENRTFSEEADAKLWLLQRNEEGKIQSQSIKKKSISKQALQNSAAIRADTLRLMIQVTAGVGARKRIKTLLERGADSIELEKIWRDAHGDDIIPDVLRTILYGKEKRP